MDLHIYVSILCIGGLCDFLSVFGEVADEASTLHAIRGELNILKLANERNELKIVLLERQVSECHTKYAELTMQTTSVARIDQQLAYISHKVETSRQELSERLKSLEMSKRMEQENYMEDNNATAEDEPHDGLVPAKDETDHGLTNLAKKRTSVESKRIVPVTGIPPSTKTRVAFTAFPPQRHGLNMALQQTLPFSGLLTNEGNAFNPTTHTFTCPVSGVYYFASSLDINTILVDRAPVHVFETQIVKDGLVLVQAFSSVDIMSEEFSHPSFNSVVTVCNKGEAVWVRLTLSQAATITFQGKHTTFTGFILWQL